MRQPKWRLALFSLILIFMAGILAAADKQPLTVTFLDVGQGDCTIIATPAGKTAIIDGGLRGKAKSVIIPFLKSKGIKTIDTMVMTHADSDHIGGLVYFLENAGPGGDYPLEIKELLDPGQKHTTILYQDLLSAAKKRPETRYKLAKKGDRIDWGDGITAEVVSPDHIYKDANNSSIVLKIAYGKVSMLLTGDAEFDAEQDMIKNYGDKLKSNVLKAGHHGSAYASSAEFLNKVKPEVVILSIGEHNKFNLPFKEAMDRLSATGAKSYRTDYEGDITLTTDGETYKIATEREAPPLEKRWDHQAPVKEGDKVNINTATLDELISLPMIGETKAKGIIARRPFTSADDLRRVPRIGEKIVERLRPLVTVTAPKEAPTPPSGTTPIDSIKKEDVGKKAVTVSGTIKSIKVFRDEKGRSFLIKDQSGAIDILIWKDLYETIPDRDKLANGATIKVRGGIDSHKDKLQIKPATAADIQIIKTAAEAEKGK